MCRSRNMITFRASTLLVLLVLASKLAYGNNQVYETDSEYVERILSYLNNNEECTMPTFEQLDELHTAFKALQKERGDNFESTLTDDQKLALETVLEDWKNFRDDMDSPVRILSAKKRAFLRRVELYQRKKFGDSVCIRFKDVKGPVTNRIFEKNPIIRYLRHLETGEVAEFPSEAEYEVEAKAIAEAAERARVEQEEKERIEAEERARVEQEERERIEAETRAKAEREEQLRAEVEEKTSAAAEARALAEEEAKLRMEAEEGARKADEAIKKARVDMDEKQRTMDEIRARFQAEADARAKLEERLNELAKHRAEIEERLNAVAKESAKLEAKLQAETEEKLKAKERAAKERDERLEAQARMEEEKARLKAEREAREENQMCDIKYSDIDQLKNVTDEFHGDDDVERDPLAEIPAPHIHGETNAKGPVYDANGNRLFNADEDGADLDRLVAVPQNEWQYDNIYGYFKWPDECNGKAKDSCNDAVDWDDDLLSLGGTWALFMNDPYGFDKQQKKKNKPVRRGQLVNEMVDQRRRDIMFGHDTHDMAPPLFELPKGINKDRWRYIANNNYCKIGFNQASIVHSTKKSYQTAKSFTTKTMVSARRKLLSMRMKY